MSTYVSLAEPGPTRGGGKHAGETRKLSEIPARCNDLCSWSATGPPLPGGDVLMRLLRPSAMCSERHHFGRLASYVRGMQ